MKLKMIVITVFIACMSFACGETECDEATAKLEECNLPTVVTSGASCEGVDLCEANCINQYSCDDIRAALLNSTPNAYSACDDACN
jgi:hypothetical protein